jgi:NADH-quinone oxidoreductase subunit G
MGGKLLPTCATEASDGMVVYANNPKAVANQKAVMEYLLINHPLDCPVCDQAGECSLQDYSYKYGRSGSRFQEQKVKQPKKDLGPNILIYSDRCIMCTRCVRFAREVAGTGELMIDGRGNKSQIDVFPGVPLQNEIASNVIDICPVGALLDKDFLFAQRVWFLKSTPGIDPLTSSGDNIWIEHNQGKVYRFKPRENMDINTWWISDEVRYGWKFVHGDKRLRQPLRRSFGRLVECEFERAFDDAVSGLRPSSGNGSAKPLGIIVSPMITSEEAYALAQLAQEVSGETGRQVTFGLGPVPVQGEDRIYPKGANEGDPGAFVVCAEKAPNARGVKQVLESVAKGDVLDADAMFKKIESGAFGALILTGNYPSEWATEAHAKAVAKARDGGAFVVLMDTLVSRLVEHCDVLLPSSTWLEKSGTFTNHRGQIQAFEQAIPPVELSKSEGQLAYDLISNLKGEPASSIEFETIAVDRQPGQVSASVSVARPRVRLFNPADVRSEMGQAHKALSAFLTDVMTPTVEAKQEADLEVVEL